MGHDSLSEPSRRPQSRGPWPAFGFTIAWLLGPVANAAASLAHDAHLVAALQASAWTSAVALAITAWLVLASAEVRERTSFQVLLCYWLGLAATLPAFDSHIPWLQRHASAFLLAMPIVIPASTLVDSALDARLRKRVSL